MDKSKFSEESILKELDAILSWPQLRASETLARFLKFVVNETINGRAFEIKEYTIGLNVFKRPTTFNPQKDAIVRISGGRLRRLLSRYYESKEKEPRLRISIPKGTYVPVFEEYADDNYMSRRDGANKIAVAVLPFWNMSERQNMDNFVDGLGEMLMRYLAGRDEFDVIAYRSLQPHFNQASVNLFEKIDAQYFVTGNIHFTDTGVELSVQVIFALGLRLVWSSTLSRPMDADTEMYKLQRELVEEIGKSLRNLNGLLLEHLCQLPLHTRTEVVNNRNPAFWLFYYKKLYSKEALTASHQSITSTLTANPLDSVAHAVLSQLMADSHLFGLTLSDAPLQDALMHAEKSIQLNPKNQYGYVALAYAHLLIQNRDKSLSAIRQGVSLHEGVTSTLGMMGVIKIFNGEYRQGFDKLSITLETNPYCRWLHEIAVSLYYFNNSEYEKAYQEVRVPESDINMLSQVLRVAALGKQKQESVVTELGRLKNGHPDILTQVRPQLEMLLMDKTLIDELISGVTMAIEMETKKKTKK